MDGLKKGKQRNWMLGQKYEGKVKVGISVIRRQLNCSYGGNMTDWNVSFTFTLLITV